MPSVNDVVELTDGSVGVVAEVLSSANEQLYRVWFTDHHRVISVGHITQTLSAPSYSVNDEVGVWPHLGTIKIIDGDSFTVEVEHHQFIPGLGSTSWVANQVVPRWRIIRDNDGRIEGVN